MSLSQLVEDHADTLVFRTDRFADSVTQKRKGQRTPATVPVIKVWDIPDPRNTETRDAKLRGTLHIADSVVVSMSDLWTIGGVVYATIGLGDPEHGTREVRIERRQGDIRRGSLGVI
jgi:hypothetical protein